MLSKLSLGFAGILLSFGALSTTAADDVVPFPKGFRDWFVVNSMIVTTDSPISSQIGGLHHIYVNAKGRPTLKEGGRFPYPDGTIFADDVHEFGEFVRSLAHRIASFPAAGHIAIKDRVNAIALAPAEDFRHDAEVFGVGLRNPEAQNLIQAAFERGLQTRHAELDLARMLGDSAVTQI